MDTDEAATQPLVAELLAETSFTGLQRLSASLGLLQIEVSPQLLQEGTTFEKQAWQSCAIPDNQTVFGGSAAQ